MFGYVRPHKAELLVREYEQYKAIYCELCRELGKSFGIGTRLILSYDCTFYAVLALGVTGSEITSKKKHCVVNPLKKCNYLASWGEEYKKAAALSVVMTYHKLKDNIEDDSFFKALSCRFLLPFMRRKYKKAARLYPFIAEAVEKAMAGQAEAEAAEDGSIDRCSEPTAHMLSVLLEELSGDAGQKMVLRQIGYFLGRWVYIMDAADDLAEDLKTGSFNPFIKKLHLERYLPENTQGDEFSGEEKKKAELACNEVLNTNIAMMIPPLNLLKLKNFGGIVQNILTKGLPEMQREILFLHSKEKKNDRPV